MIHKVKQFFKIYENSNCNFIIIESICNKISDINDVQSIVSVETGTEDCIISYYLEIMINLLLTIFSRILDITGKQDICLKLFKLSGEPALNTGTVQETLSLVGIITVSCKRKI